MDVKAINAKSLAFYRATGWFDGYITTWAEARRMQALARVLRLDLLNALWGPPKAGS